VDVNLCGLRAKEVGEEERKENITKENENGHAVVSTPVIVDELVNEQNCLVQELKRHVVVRAGERAVREEARSGGHAGGKKYS
jgi:hypothetical protein